MTLNLIRNPFPVLPKKPPAVSKDVSVVSHVNTNKYVRKALFLLFLSHFALLSRGAKTLIYEKSALFDKRLQTHYVLPDTPAKVPEALGCSPSSCHLGFVLRVPAISHCIAATERVCTAEAVKRGPNASFTGGLWVSLGEPFGRRCPTGWSLVVRAAGGPERSVCLPRLAPTAS